MPSMEVKGFKLAGVEYTSGVGLPQDLPANDARGVDAVWDEKHKHPKTESTMRLPGFAGALAVEIFLPVAAADSRTDSLQSKFGFEEHSGESQHRRTQFLPPQTDRDLEWRLLKTLRGEAS